MAAKIAELLEDPNMARYSITRILEGMNDAVAEWCIRTRCVYDAVDIPFTATQRDYNIKTYIDAGGNRELGIIERIGIYNGITQDWPYEFLKGLSLHELDRLGLSSYGDGPAQAWYNDLGDFHEISILPVPDVNYSAGPPKNNGAYVLYAGIPALMTYSAPDFGGLDALLPTLAQLPICFGAAGMILEYGQGEELNLAQERLAVFEKGIQDCIQGAVLAATDYGEVEPI
jgi:hypothetical protein